jgi:hypothetical protein
MASVLPLHRVIPIGDQFQGFQSAQGDGLFHRLNGINRLFYTREFAKAEDLLTILATEGVNTLREKAAADAALYGVWEEMSKLGFFYNSDPVVDYTIAWLLDERSGSLTSQVEACRAGYAALSYYSPLFHVHTRSADAAAGLCEEVERAAKRVAPPPPAAADGDRTGPILCLFSPLLGDESGVPSLIDYLERGNVPLTYEAPVGEGAAGNPVLQRLEEEGFLPAFRASLAQDLVLDPARRASAAAMVGRWLNEQANREVNLRFTRPRTFGSPALLHEYFDGLEAFLDSLLDLDADLSRLSVVQRASLCLLQSRNVDHFLQASVNADGAMEFRQYFDDDFVATVQPSPDDVEAFRRRLVEAIGGECNGAGCCNATFERFSPKHLAAAFPRETEGEAAEEALVAERRRRIWQKLFGWLLDELLHISRENVEFGTPLRLDITPDRQAKYSPLYQST